MNGAFVELFRVGVPPVHTAGIGAELLFLAVRLLLNRLTAELAHISRGDNGDGIIRNRSDIIPSAK